MTAPDPSYAVAWSDRDAAVLPGKLELGRTGFRLESGTPRGRLLVRSIRYADLDEVRVGRTAERLRARRTLVLALASGEYVRLASMDGPGTTHEIAERLGSARAEAA
jgi:hypothetical protein